VSRLRSSLKNSAPKERHNLAHGASRGLKAHSLSPFPSPARPAVQSLQAAGRRERGVRRGDRGEGLRTQGSRPGLRSSAPNGAGARSGSHSGTLSTNLPVRTLSDTLKYRRRERGVTLAVSLRQSKTLIEHPFSMTHSALPDEQKRAFGMHPEGVRLSIGLEDCHDMIRDLELALEKV
jgi:hypothetical protein